MTFESIDVATLDGDREWWSIYEESIPAREREPREDILRALSHGRVLVIRARKEDRTIGLAMVHLLEQPAAGFLVYLAVDRAARGGGVGGAILEYAIGASQQALTEPAGMVWEVDVPSGEDSVRRIAFFEKHGAKVLNCSYVQPPIDGIAPVPMVLMFLPFASSPEVDVGELVQAMYREKYEAVNHVMYRG
jgi:GNAT superfamily N-acetyltransferase